MAKKNAEESAEAPKNRGGRVAYEAPAKHREVLRRSQTRVENAKKALAEAEESRYAKIVAALNDGVKPSAIARSLDAPYITVQRAVNKAREAGEI